MAADSQEQKQMRRFFARQSCGPLSCGSPLVTIAAPRLYPIKWRSLHSASFLFGKKNQLRIQDLKKSGRALRVIDIEIHAAYRLSGVERPAEAKDH